MNGLTTMKSFFFALQHLSRIRLYSGEFDEVAFGRSGLFFPLVGLLLGLVVLLASLTFQAMFPWPLVSALMLITLVALTGGIHLDGFMDALDGLLSGRPQDRKMEIMRDSRVGAFGVLGVVCLILLKYLSLLSLPTVILFQTVILALVISRWSMVLEIALFPYARSEGLGTLFSRHTGKRELFWATLLTLAIVGVVAGVAGLIMVLLIAGVVYYGGRKITMELGGLTGDIYGATCEITELLVYLAAFPIYQYLPRLFSTGML